MCKWVMFNSYVKLPEGISNKTMVFLWFTRGLITQYQEDEIQCVLQCSWRRSQPAPRLCQLCAVLRGEKNVVVTCWKHAPKRLWQTISFIFWSNSDINVLFLEINIINVGYACKISRRSRNRWFPRDLWSRVIGPAQIGRSWRPKETLGRQRSGASWGTPTHPEGAYYHLVYYGFIWFIYG